MSKYSTRPRAAARTGDRLNALNGSSRRILGLLRIIEDWLRAAKRSATLSARHRDWHVELEADAKALRAEWDTARSRSRWFGASRPRVPPPLRGAGGDDLPGELPGDYAFDPLALWASSSEARRRWIAEAELLHGRWAMLGALGALVPEALTLAGVALGEPVWWKARGHCRHHCNAV